MNWHAVVFFTMPPTRVIWEPKTLHFPERINHNMADSDSFCKTGAIWEAKPLRFPERISCSTVATDSFCRTGVVWETKCLRFPRTSQLQHVCDWFLVAKTQSTPPPSFMGIPLSMKHPQDDFSFQNGNWHPLKTTVRVEIITGSLVILENLFPQNYRYRYRLEIRMN